MATTDETGSAGSPARAYRGSCPPEILLPPLGCNSLTSDAADCIETRSDRCACVTGVLRQAQDERDPSKRVSTASGRAQRVRDLVHAGAQSGQLGQVSLQGAEERVSSLALAAHEPIVGRQRIANALD